MNLATISIWKQGALPGHLNFIKTPLDLSVYFKLLVKLYLVYLGNFSIDSSKMSFSAILKLYSKLMLRRNAI